MRVNVLDFDPQQGISSMAKGSADAAQAKDVAHQHANLFLDKTKDTKGRWEK
jgi:hypothetical protein